MVSSSKILTVSYGTFSCTLEGFEESFDTMKAIAEYFRDLAQDDRYFGAEPPTPDAEMLARIAEREIARRVEARMENGSYVLRPSLSGPDAAPAKAQPEPQSEPASEPAVAATAPQAAPEASPLPEPETQAEPQITATAEAETAPAATGNAMAQALAAQQAMARDAAAQADADAQARTEAAVAAPAQVASEETAVDGTQPAAEATHAEDEASTPDAAVEDDAAPDPAKPDDAAQDPLQLSDPVAPLPSARVATDDNSVAAKLQRIRAVVSASGAPSSAYSGPAYSEDEHADAFLTDTSQDDAFDAGALGTQRADAAPAVEPTPEYEAAADDDADTLGENLFTDTIAGFVADQEAYDDEDPEDEAPGIATAESAPDGAPENDPDLDDDSDPRDTDQGPVAATRPRARLLRVKRADFDAALAAGTLDDRADAADPESSLSAEEEADLARELAEVEAELDRAWDWDDTEDAALSETATAKERPGLDDLADLSDDDDADEDAYELDDRPEPRRDTGLRLRKDAPVAQPDDIEAEDDDDNDAILAAVSRASQDGADAAPHSQEVADQPTQTADDSDETASDRRAIEGARKTLRLSSPAHAMLTQNKIEEDDTSVSRILDETNTQLEEPEGNRRRSAIAHLRAAVAATRADRILGRKKDPEKETEPYRADLASAVRPRRPMPSAEARSERPAMPRPAPLKLVAEQRIDAPEAAVPQAAAPVRPRRVTRSLETDTAPGDIEEDSGFVAFAEDMGATDLPDLLEAAAAYMSFVEGRDQFSRPQLMTKVRLAENGESSREDRLRSFGQLLREGKIEKTHGGRFTASERISFKPGARAAG